jgi:hypothetical protein
MLIRFTSPRPVEPMSMAEARRIITDLDWGQQFDPGTRMMAWHMCLAARRGEAPAVVMITLTPATALPMQPMPPKDAA